MPSTEKDQAAAEPASAKETKEADVAEVKEEELSEEDAALKEGLDLAVERLREAAGVHMSALEHLRTEIRSSTSSMTAVPKPLKFLRPHYQTLKDIYGTWSASEKKVFLADILSCLAMTMAEEGTRESLHYKLEGDTTDLGSWGHEYVRSLAGEIGQEYAERTTSEPPRGVDDLMAMVDVIVPFHVDHNAEAEAVDLLMEVQQLSKLLSVASIDESNYERICLYLLRCTSFLDSPEDLDEVLQTTFELYRSQGALTDACRVALRLVDKEKVSSLFGATDDEGVRKQLACIVSRSRMVLELDGEDDLNEIIGNVRLGTYFLSLARDLDVLEPKHPDDVYKSKLSEGGFRRGRTADVALQSARQNLASSFVNGFVNAGFCTDKLMLGEDSGWIYKNQDQGLMSAAASLGLLQLWNIEEGLNVIDKFLYAKEDKVKAGATLAIGLLYSGISDGTDAAAGLLSDYMDNPNADIKVAAAMGLGIAYAGSGSQMAAEALLPVVAETDGASFDVVAAAALALGQIFVGTCDEEACGTIVQRLMESTETELNQPTARNLCTGLALLFLGQQEKVEGMLEAVQTVEHKISKTAAIILETCAYAGTGNVLKVQQMMHLCAEHLEEEDAAHQAAAVVGISIIAAGEDVGSEMVLRVLDHFLHFGDLPIRRAVPIAYAMLHVSDPQNVVIDSLSRLTHDQDAQVAQGAILGLGLIGAGTNNSRIAGLLRQLSDFYAREADQLFVTRIAQGLLHMGKGLLTLHPFHSDRVLLSGPAMAGILPVLQAALDMPRTLLGNHHHLLFHLVPAMTPRMMMTVDENMDLLPISVRVGQAVETVGQAGRPKTITGFQTHTSPVLLNAKDRAELASGEYIALSSVLEDVVIVRKNPDWEEGS